MSFEGRKATVLKDFYALLNDRSPKGSVDAPILNCINMLNEHKNYYTTSSCSGRVAIFCEPSNTKSKDGFWLYVSHDPIEPSDTQLKLDTLLKQPLQSQLTISSDRFVYFKFEPLILHVECRDENSATVLYSKVYQLGFRNSGISISKKKRNNSTTKQSKKILSRENSLNTDDGTIEEDKKYVVAIRSSLKLDVPIMVLSKDGFQFTSLVDSSYLDILIKLANQKFKQNQDKITELEIQLQTL